MKIPAFLGTYRGLPKSVYYMCTSELLSSLGNFVLPYTTLILTVTLNFSPGRAGALVTLMYTLLYVPGALIGGRIADLIGRKRSLTIALTGRALCYLYCSYIGPSPTIVPFMAMGVFFMGFAMPAYQSLMMDLTKPENRKSAFALEYLARNVGISFGYLTGGFLFNRFLYVLFLGNAIGVTAMLILITRFVPESKPTVEIIQTSLEEGETAEKAEEGGLIAAMIRRPLVLAFSFVMILYTFVLGQNTFSLPIQLDELFAAGGPPFYGSVMMVNGLTVVFCTTLITALTLRNSPVRNVSLAGILFAIGYGAITFYEAAPYFYFSAVIWTWGEILMMTNARVFIANHTPMSHRGRFASVIPIFTGSGLAIGPLVMGRYIQHFGIRSVWPLLAVLGLLGTFLMTALHQWERWAGERYKRVGSDTGQGDRFSI